MSSPENKNSALTPYVKRLVFLFGLVYFAQGVAQAAGLLSQPLMFYFKEALGFAPDVAANYMAILTLPWVIKPVYGLLSDFVPLFGYRRKTWLVAMNGLAALGFLWLSGVTSANLIVIAMMLTAIGTAASDVIIDALMVENGNKFGVTAKFQSVQWLWFYIAAITTSLAGGYLCDYFSPGTALSTAALISMCAPATVIVASWLIVKEEKAAFNKQQLADTMGGLKEAVRSRTLRAVAFFLAFYYFSPSMGMPMFYHMTDKLGFSQEFIGQLGAIGAVGSVFGALAYGRYFGKKSLRFQLLFAILSGFVGTLAYLALVTPSPYAQAIAITLSLVFGAAGTIALLTTLTLAARACPKRAEGFTFAALMSVTNGFQQLAGIAGAWMFVHWFGNSLTPLIWVSALATLACVALLPMLKSVEALPGSDTTNGDEGK